MDKTVVGLNAACNVYPDKCWFVLLCRFWLQCSLTLSENELFPYEGFLLNKHYSVSLGGISTLSKAYLAGWGSLRAPMNSKTMPATA